MATATSAKMQIAFVEDDPAQAALISHLLQSNVVGDVEIVTFIDSRKAAEHIDHHWVDVLVTDLDMPEFNGLQLVERARRQNSWTQSLLMTSASTASAVVDAGDLGATDYLLKPVDPQLLIRLIHQSLDRLERWQQALSGTLKRSRALRRAKFNSFKI